MRLHYLTLLANNQDVLGEQVKGISMLNMAMNIECRKMVETHPGR